MVTSNVAIEGTLKDVIGYLLFLMEQLLVL